MIIPMSKSAPEITPALRALLESYIRKETALPEMRNQLYQSLQTIFPQSAEPGRELLAEILAGIYEVEDGVRAEATFRQILNGFLAKNPVLAVPVVVAD